MSQKKARLEHLLTCQKVSFVKLNAMYYLDEAPEYFVVVDAPKWSENQDMNQTGRKRRWQYLFGLIYFQHVSLHMLFNEYISKCVRYNEHNLMNMICDEHISMNTILYDLFAMNIFLLQWTVFHWALVNPNYSWSHRPSIIACWQAAISHRLEVTVIQCFWNIL